MVNCDDTQKCNVVQCAPHAVVIVQIKLNLTFSVLLFKAEIGNKTPTVYILY